MSVTFLVTVVNACTWEQYCCSFLSKKWNLPSQIDFFSPTTTPPPNPLGYIIKKVFAVCWKSSRVRTTWEKFRRWSIGAIASLRSHWTSWRKTCGSCGIAKMDEVREESSTLFEIVVEYSICILRGQNLRLCFVIYSQFYNRAILNRLLSFVLIWNLKELRFQKRTQKVDFMLI